ncbi:MAG: type II/IV secretion system ATPase subunit [Candidatus Bathyarchaeia archaeon]
MHLRFRLRSMVNRKIREENVQPTQGSVGFGGVLLEPKVGGAIPTFREVYALREPHVYAAISRDPETGSSRYHVIEPTMTDDEKASLERIKEIILQVVDVNLNSLDSREKAEEWLRNYVDGIIRNYKVKVGLESLDKIKYYLARDLVGFGKIDPMMHDHMLEDISCDGPRIPIYVWHRVYESLPTNVTFEDEGELDSFIVRLAYLAGKHISIASPMLDASLKDGSRIQLTYGREVTRKGSTFTIRRFRADPLTVPDLIELGTMNPMMAAWFWMMVERKFNILIGGGTASGKTTTLNALCAFIPANSKIVTIEDTPELNIPHENWISSVARVGFGPGGVADITLYDLLKAAMRQRPDYVIVGEVRGEEAYILFQAMATGHGGLSSIHCDSVTSAFSRLESEPMNIPRTLIPILDVVLIQSRTRLAERVARRVTSIVEIVELDPVSKEIITNEVFRWDPKRDLFEYSGRSILLDRVMRDYGVTKEYLSDELERRALLLEWAARNRIRRVGEVGELIRYYYANPEAAMEKVKLRLKE